MSKRGNNMKKGSKVLTVLHRISLLYYLPVGLQNEVFAAKYVMQFDALLQLKLPSNEWMNEWVEPLKCLLHVVCDAGIWVTWAPDAKCVTVFHY